MDHTDPEVLQELYHEDGMSLRALASECDVTTSAIRYQMKKHDIERRNSGDHSGGGRKPDGDVPEREWLREKYQDEGMSQAAIGDMLGVAQSTIGRYLSDYGIETRCQGPTDHELGSMTESDVIDVLTDVLDANGHEYETEEYLGDWLCDVYDTDTDTAYEAKGWGSTKPDLLKAIGQAGSYLAHGAETAYVVAPADSVRGSHEKTFSTLRIGLIAIEEGSATVVSSCEAEYLS